MCEALAPLRADGTLPEFPLGSDFTPVEQRLLPALGWLKRQTASRRGTLATVTRALLSRGGTDEEALRRMALDAPATVRERLEARLLALALRETGR